MDFNLKKWRDRQHESEDELQHQQQSAKIPRQLLIDSPQQEAAALPLFVSAESQSDKMITTHFSAYSDHSSTPTAIPTRLPRMGGRYSFSMAQWQELELQALIYRHIVAGATIPAELLHLVKKSLFTSSSSPYYLHPYSSSFQSAALLQAGYWGKGAMDPEPGRCRRTDGKKWRCSRDVVAGHKYCERHMHRGRNRSRKPVEFPASAGTVATGGDAAAVVDSFNKSSTTPFAAGSIVAGGSGAAHFSLSGSGGSSFDAFQLNTGRSAELRSDKKSLFGSQHNSASEDGKSNNKVLMHFFDDWPRSLQESENGDVNGNMSSTSLSITPGNSTSDFLRLSTGNGEELGRRDGNQEQERNQISWTGGWGGNPVASTGGPLAEALRSSSTSSPTSVLHQLSRSAPDNSYVTA